VEGCDIQETLHDVETLNRMAFDQRLDATKLSFYAWLEVRENYRLLTSGAALGYGCGPLVIAPQALTLDDMAACRIVLPGQWTTAHLLFRLWAPMAHRRIFLPYDRIFDALRDGTADAGVIIHESRFTFQAAGFLPVVDLGAWWEQRTGLPIPLGCIAVHRRVPEEIALGLEEGIRRSILLARQDFEGCREFIRHHAQEMSAEVQQAHIATYVNDFTLDLGTEGRRAVAVLEHEAHAAGFLTGG
jgi:1,4-dihydroxy-6-naphthoate synthase